MKVFSIVLVLLFSLLSVNVMASGFSWTMLGERITGANNSSSFFSSSPVNATGFATKTACETAITEQNALVYDRKILYQMPTFSSLVVAKCHKVLDAAVIPVPAP